MIVPAWWPAQWRRQLKALVKYPRDRWNKRLRKLDRQRISAVRTGLICSADRLNFQMKHDPAYRRLDKAVAEADAEWDRTHDLDEETDEWREK